MATPGANEKAEGATHLEGVDKDTVAALSAEEMLQVDDKRAAELRRELEGNLQGGWKATTDEEKRLNRRLNMRLDLMVSI